MTRKDFLLISEAVRAARREADRAPVSEGSALAIGARLSGVDATARELADALGRNNGRFDKERFLRDCGVQS